MWVNRDDWDDFTTEVLAQLYQITHLLKVSIGQENTMAKGLDDLHAAAAAQTSVISSVSTLLQGLAQKLKDAVAGDDDSAVEELANQIAANTASLAQAVASNTPAAPAPAAPPAPATPAAG